ncbi:retron Eco8 family effector endonuclease [Lysinibacillus sphaericus]|uniref:retron Eco8 family effector endonuclease n=1 Tax=Lysinibacillus sphaericus TaxID=1421 RepID=UPI0025A23226|nr:retron Eco8 family effector endonuclease [Lysinibacillus sphaericus]MDM5352030.1 retron Eco8 family effector endonuclease [Lysinibacillus sphaericus]
MGISKIEFENVRSLKDTYIKLSELNVLVGTNGAGKTNIEKYISYFYDNLLSNKITNEVFDKKNPYNDSIKITLLYDLTKLNEIGKQPPNKEFFEQIKLYIGEVNELKLSFVQYKDNTYKWSHSYEVRRLIKYLFPIYFIDTRNIDLLNWDSIWEIVGGLGQQRSMKESQLMEKVEDVLEDIYGDRHSKNFESLKNEIKSTGYNIKSYKNSELFTQLYKLEFKGEEFQYRNNSLDFYSNGSNSFNYLRIFYLVLKKLHTNKLKEPLVILDEPEIGLHPTLIDELIDIIANNNGKIQTVLSSHSSRVIKNCMVLDKTNIFQIRQKNFQTYITKVKSFEDNKLNRVISDKEASYYFSTGILFVEGITEYELFTHPLLKQKFPILNQIEIFSYNSNNISLDVSHPRQRRMNIPYLLLLDLDKILKYVPEKKKFKIIGDSYNPLKNEEICTKENYYYGPLRKRQTIRKRIEGITKKVSFSYNPDTFAFNDLYFKRLKILVKNYCNFYSVYPVETTIEGVLINFQNYELFYHWIISDQSNYKEKEKEKIIEAYNKSKDVDYRLNILRTIVEGKLEPLVALKSEYINSISKGLIKDGYKIIVKLPKIKKGSGWVTDFINYVYKELEMKNDLKSFTKLFPELTDIIETIGTIME